MRLREFRLIGSDSWWRTDRREETHPRGGWNPLCLFHTLNDLESMSCDVNSVASFLGYNLVENVLL